MFDDPRLPERFWIKVIPELNSGCWLWIAATNNSGYGWFGVAGKSIGCHRVTYESFIGPIPKGWELDHLCQTRSCCNPWHLQAVTSEENKRRQGSRVTKCRHGHLFTPENTRIKNNGTRACKECNRRWVRQIYQRRKAH